MYEWKKLFSQKILTRGRLYFDAKQVHSLRYDGNAYSALISGRELYNVSVRFENDTINKMTCNCPYAKSGLRCKHMAAALYAIEASNEETNPLINEKTFVSLFEPGETHGKYFDLFKITKNWVISNKNYKKAKNLYELRKTDKVHISAGYNNFYRSNGISVSARYGDTQNYWGDPNICIDKDSVLQMSCSCSKKMLSYSPYLHFRGESSEPCEHILMLIMCMNDYIQKYNPGDITDYHTSQFLNAFRRRTTGERVQRENDHIQSIKLVPRVEYSGGLTLSFKIGRTKMYLVKKLAVLTECVRKKKAMAISKNEELDFSVDEFDEESQAYFELIEKFIREEKLRESENVIGGKGRSINDRIRLFGSILDEFYDLASSTSPEFTIKNMYEKSCKSTLTFSNRTPKIKLDFKQTTDAEDFQGIKIYGQLPDLIEGSRYRYYLDGNCLNRITQNDYESLRILFDFSPYGELNLTIGRKSLSEFYYNVLPELKKVVETDENNIAQIMDFIPPEAQFAFYLDCEQGIPACKAYVSYGEEVYSLARNEASDTNDLRNYTRETEVRNKVRQYFKNPLTTDDSFLCFDDEEAVFEVLESGINDFLKIGEVHCTDRFNALKIKRKVKIEVGVSIESDLMNLTVTTNDISHEELIDILKSYKAKKKYHRLRNGSFVSLDSSIAEFSALVDSIHIDEKQLIKNNIRIPAYRALYLDKMLELCGDVQTQRDSRFKKFIKDFKTVKESDFEPPKSLLDIMRSYQTYGYKWLRTVSECGFGAILADDMGLGKTLQMISVLLSSKEEGGSGTSIVICPASLIYNWQEEFKKFAPSLDVCVVAGNAKEREALIRHYDDFDVLITSYDLFKRDIVCYENKDFEYQILDEAQNIKNQSTVASKSVKILNSKRRFALTGTPIENRLGELWSIFDYLMPGFLYSYEAFKKDFETPIVKKQDKEATERLKNMVSPFILRRLKTDVLKDLPEKIEEVRYAKFSESQQKLYDGQVVHMQKILDSQSEDAFAKSKLQILAELTKIRQICCDPSLIFENYEGESAKREACIDLILSAIHGNHKILVFSQFTSMFELLEKDLAANRITYYKITGETDKRQRLEMVRKFNSDSTNVFLISLKAGGTGLNLTGADVVIHYDPWWNVAAQNQATDRAHRIGQDKVVSVYKLIAKNTIEEKILTMQEKKKELADAVISGNAGHFASMSREDIIKLIQ